MVCMFRIWTQGFVSLAGIGKIRKMFVSTCMWYKNIMLDALWLANFRLLRRDFWFGLKLAFTSRAKISGIIFS